MHLQTKSSATFLIFTRPNTRPRHNNNYGTNATYTNKAIHSKSASSMQIVELNVEASPVVFLDVAGLQSRVGEKQQI